jgi:asparagine synthase (glutamine-hydrolysing)
LFEYSADYGSAYYLRRGLFLPWELPEFLDGELVREGWRELSLINTMNASVAEVGQPRNKVAVLESMWYMRNQLLRDSDWAGMAHSLEIRTPLVDATLFVQLAARGFSKQDMARSPKVALPESVLNRPKTGFAIPVRDWLQGQGNDEGGERGVRGWAKTIYEQVLN